MSQFKVDFKSNVFRDENGRKCMESMDSITEQITRRYLDHCETCFIQNLEQTPLIVLAQTIHEECMRRDLSLSFHKDPAGE